MNWLDPALAHLDAGTPAMWVVLATARGSSPRDAGAAAVVTATDFAGTLGGGTLEYRAIELARTLLGGGTAGAHLRVPLGPSLASAAAGSSRWRSSACKRRTAAGWSACSRNGRSRHR
jgi:xanthine dehydrogenase accessory factor